METQPRRSRFDPEAPTFITIRRNLRNLRAMQSLTLVDVIARIGGTTTLTPLLLGRIEAGDRDISAVELMQLAVALQVSPNDLMLPWTQTEMRSSPIASGVDPETCRPQDLFEWSQNGLYPRRPHALTQKASAIEGQALTDALADPASTARLADDPNPRTYAAVLSTHLQRRFRPIYLSVAQVYDHVADWLPDADPRSRYKVNLPHEVLEKEHPSSTWKRLQKHKTWEPNDVGSFNKALEGVQAVLLTLKAIETEDLHDSEFATIDTNVELGDWLLETKRIFTHMQSVLNALAITVGIQIVPFLEGEQHKTRVSWPEAIGAPTFFLEPKAIVPSSNAS